MESQAELSGKKVLLMAIATGIIVANLNYIQPIEGLIAATFDVSKATVGSVATLSQLGYAFGLLLIVPLGDIFNRYKLIQFMMCLSQSHHYFSPSGHQISRSSRSLRFWSV